MTTETFKLKLLNGPLIGRELYLPQGEFTIGDGDSDLSLSLEGGGQALLRVMTEGVCPDGAKPCWVTGRRWTSGPLPLGQPIDLAGVHLVLGLAQDELGNPAVCPRGGPYRLVAGVVLGTLLLASALGWSLLRVPTPLQTGQRNWLQQEMRNAPSLRAKWLGPETLVLEGRCNDCGRLTALVNRLRADGVRVRQEAVCDDDLLRSVKMLLASFGNQNVTVTLDADGRAEIDGTVRGDMIALATALDKLPGLPGWQFVDRGADELSTLVSRLQSIGLLAGLSATRSDAGWLLSGQLDEARLARLDTFLGQADTKSAYSMPLRYIGSASSATTSTYLPAAISAVGGNPSAPYLQLSNGMRLVLNSPVAQGMRVVAIGPDGVSLAGGRQLVFLPLHG